MGIDQPLATVIAASIAACVSVGTLVVTLISNRRLAQFEDFTEERKEVRKHLIELAELLQRTEASARRLVALAPTFKSEEDLIIEATNTMAIVSETFRATGSDRLIRYSDKVVPTITIVRQKLTRLFLELEMSEESRKKSDRIRKLGELCDDLSHAVSDCRAKIRAAVAPPAI